MGQPILLPGLLSENSAAVFLGGISVTKLRQLRIPRRRLGGRVFYDRRDLESYIDNLPYEGGDAGAVTGSKADAWFEGDD